MIPFNSGVKETSLATFARGLSEKHLIVSGFGYPKWTEKDVRLPETAVRCGYCAVIAIVNSTQSCREAWERTGQDRLNPENYTETDDKRATELLYLPNVRAVIVHDAPGSWPVIAALHEAVEENHPGDCKLAYRAKKPYTKSRGAQTAEQLRIPTFSDQIDESRTPVPQDNLPETPGFQFSESCRIYVPSR